MRKARNWFRLIGLIVFFISLSVPIRTSHAVPAGGGGRLDRLTFRNANATSCGTWQVEGSAAGGRADYQLTDGMGRILDKNTVLNFHGQGIVFSGRFDVLPKKNPIKFTVSGTFLESPPPVDNPCLPSSLQGKIAFSSFGQIYIASRRGWNAQPLLQGVVLQGEQRGAVWSPDGKFVAYFLASSDESQLFVSDATGNNVRQLTTSHVQKISAAWSPDGKQLAFNEADLSATTGGVWAVTIVNADGTGLKRLTSNKVNEVNPVWSPDGKRLAFRSEFNGQNAIYVINKDGDNLQLVTTFKPMGMIGEGFSENDPSWSPDGKSLAFSIRDESAYRNIYAVNVDGSHLRRLTDNKAENFQPVWSPDGKHIAFAYGKIFNEGCSATLYVMQPDGSQQTGITDRNFACGLGIGGPTIAWSPNSQQIAFAAFEPLSSNEWTIAIASLDGSPIFSITTPEMQAGSPAWGP